MPYDHDVFHVFCSSILDINIVIIYIIMIKIGLNWLIYFQAQYLGQNFKSAEKDAKKEKKPHLEWRRMERSRSEPKPEFQILNVLTNMITDGATEGILEWIQSKMIALWVMKTWF